MSDDAAPQAPAEDHDQLIVHTERVLKIRIGLSIAAFVAFVIVQVAATLTGRLEEAMIPTMALLLVSFFVLPRQVLGPKLHQWLRDHPGHPWIARAKRIHSWLTWVRLAYFIAGLALLVGLPELIDA